MKKSVIILILALMMGCAGGNTAVNTSPSLPPSSGADMIAPIAPTVTTEPAVKNISAALRKIIGLADAKIKSYEFYYAPPPDNLARDRYFVKGNKVHVLGYSVNVQRHSDYYDNVYIDTSTKKTQAFCLSVDMRCRTQGQAFAVDYNNVMIKMPYQWLKDIEYGQVVGSEMIDDRSTKKVEYEKKGVKYTQWLDETYGMPLRVQVEEPGKDKYKYDFTDMAFNSVLDDQLTPPKKYTN